MIKFKELKEAQWQQSAFAIIFGLSDPSSKFARNSRTYSNSDAPSPMFPITKKIEDTLKWNHDLLYAYHITDIPGAIRVIQNQNKKNFQLATSLHFDSESVSVSRGMHNAGVGILLRGTVSAFGMGDLFSVPDNSGKRWTNFIMLMFGVSDPYAHFSSSIEIKVHKVLERIERHLHKFYTKFYEEINMDPFPFRTYSDIIYNNRNIQDIILETDKKIKEKYVRTYIVMAEKIIEKYRDGIQEIKDEIFIRISNKESQEHYDGYTEAIMTNFKVMKVGYSGSEGLYTEPKDELRFFSFMRGENIPFDILDFKHDVKKFESEVQEYLN